MNRLYKSPAWIPAFAGMALLCLIATSATAQGKLDTALKQNGKWTPTVICNAINAASIRHGVPRNFFTRLIWIESRFDIRALSPVGAQGIAQFMPATAAARGLEDPYDPAQAIPASAALLADEYATFGNYGLAAAAYNAGPARVARYLAGTSGLPFETQDYVAAITGRPADVFRKQGATAEDFPLEKGKPFMEACRNLPVKRTRFRGAVKAALLPWGVQVAGNFSRAQVERTWTRLRSKLGTAVGDAPPQLVRARSPMGRKRIWTVRLGADTRAGAVQLCQRIRSVGGFCLVKRN